MSAIEYYGPIDLTGNELQNVTLQNLPSPPSNPKLGQTFFHTGFNKQGTWNGDEWEYTNSNTGTVTGVTASLPLSSTGGSTPVISIRDATASQSGAMTAAFAAKLGGIAAGATANDTDANLKNRANHTGTQAISTVTGLQTALDAKLSITQLATPSVNGVMSSADKTKLDGIETGATKNATDAALRARSSHTGLQAISTVTGLQTALDSKLVAADIANKADLVGGVIPDNQLPALAITSTFEVASQAAMLALTAQEGDVAIRTDLSKTFILSASPATTLANWKELRTPTAGVTAVTASSPLSSTGGSAPAISIRDATASQNGAMTAAYAAKLNGIATGATANDTDANLKNRANHTGTQSLDTTTDSSTRVAMTPAERTKLGGVATGATKNATDAQLRARSSHTGEQAISTITNLSTELDARTKKYAANIGNGTLTEFVLTHNLGTRDVTVSVARNATPWNVVNTVVELTTINTVTLRFAVAPTSNQFRVTVVG